MWRQCASCRHSSLQRGHGGALAGAQKLFAAPVVPSPRVMDTTRLAQQVVQELFAFHQAQPAEMAEGFPPEAQPWPVRLQKPPPGLAWWPTTLPA